MKTRKQIFAQSLGKKNSRYSLTFAGAILASCVTFSTLANSEIYRSTNETGAPAFSDIKTKNAKPLTLQPLNTHTPPKADTSQAPASASQQPKQQAVYSSLRIQSPSNDQVIRSNSGDISISVTVSPALQNGHRIQILIDGAVVSAAQSTTDFTLNEVYRGTHQLTARIIDLSNNSTLIISPPVEVHVKRHSILH